jgi:hypothetical protein
VKGAQTGATIYLNLDNVTALVRMPNGDHTRVVVAGDEEALSVAEEPNEILTSETLRVGG